MSVTNTTFKATVQFHTEAGDNIAFHADYVKSFVSRETLPPYDIVFEIPANSRSYSATKTVVDFQSCKVHIDLGGITIYYEHFFHVFFS